jgi:hypothetical protein
LQAGSKSNRPAGDAASGKSFESTCTGLLGLILLAPPMVFGRRRM